MEVAVLPLATTAQPTALVLQEVAAEVAALVVVLEIAASDLEVAAVVAAALLIALGVVAVAEVQLEAAATSNSSPERTLNLKLFMIIPRTIIRVLLLLLEHVATEYNCNKIQTVFAFYSSFFNDWFPGIGPAQVTNSQVNVSFLPAM